MAAPHVSLVNNPPEIDTRTGEPGNVLVVPGFARAALLVMSRPKQIAGKQGLTPVRASKRVRWRVSCEMTFDAAEFGTAEDELVILPPWPGLPELDESAPVQIEIGPLSSQKTAVALAVFPMMVKGFRFDFRCTPPEDPDGRADAWVILANVPNLRAGFYSLPIIPGAATTGIDL
jgi:hypothetical protein